MDNHEYRGVTARQPCLICGKGDWCRVSPDGWAECHRPPDIAPAGWERVKTTKSGFKIFKPPAEMQHEKRPAMQGTARRGQRTTTPIVAKATDNGKPPTPVAQWLTGKAPPSGETGPMIWCDNQWHSPDARGDFVRADWAGGAIRPLSRDALQGSYRAIAFAYGNRRLCLRVDRVSPDGTGDKIIRPANWDGKGWTLRRGDGLWPLFGLETIDNPQDYGIASLVMSRMGDDTDQPVYVVEGENCAIAMHAMGLPCVTSQGGSSNAHNTDWAPLKGRKVCILPDHDDAGRGYAETVAKILHGQGCEVSIVHLAEVFPSKNGIPHPAGFDVFDVVTLLARTLGDDLAGLVDAMRAKIWPRIHLAAMSAEPWGMADGEADQQGDAPDDGQFVGATDMALAADLLRLNADDLLHVDRLGAWFIWDGWRFREDDTREVERRFRRIPEYLREESKRQAARGDEGKAQARRLSKLASSCESAARMRNILTVARSEPAVAVGLDDLDGNAWLLNTPKGTFDLRTGELRRHEPADRLTKLAMVRDGKPITADGDDDGCSLWLKFLNEIFDGDDVLIGFIQQLVGYSLIGERSEAILPILHGSGANGKTVFCNIWAAMLGDYAKPAPAGFLLRRRNEEHATEMANLLGVRLCISAESDEAAVLNEARVKLLTGNDAISARRMRQDFFEFRPVALHVLCTNHRPTIQGVDSGIWRRICLIPFNQTFTGTRADTGLEAKLRAEMGGIIRWAVDGCLKWREAGRLIRPPVVELLTDQYRADADAVARFVSERCTINPDAKTPKATVYKAFRDWAESTGERVLSEREFALRMGKNFKHGNAKIGKGQQARSYFGLSLTRK